MGTLSKMEYVSLVPMDAVYAMIQLAIYVLKDIMDKGSSNRALVVLLAAAVVHRHIYAIRVSQGFSLPFHKPLHHHFYYVTLAFTLVLSVPVILLALHVN